MLELIPVGGDKVTIRINWAASGPSDRAHSNEQPVDADCAKLEELARRVAWCEEEIWDSPCSEPTAGSDLGQRVDQLEASLGEAIEGTLEERVAAIVERLIEEDQEEPEAAAEKVPPEPTKPSPQPEAAQKAPDETKESARGTGRIYPTPHAGVYNAGSIGRRSAGKAFFKSVGRVGDGSSIQGRRGMSSSYRRRVKARSDPYGRGYTPPKARPDWLEELKHSTHAALAASAAAASKKKGAQAAQEDATKSAPPREEAGGAKTERCEEERAAGSKCGIASAPAGSPSADGKPASPAPKAEAEVPADVEKVTSAERPEADSSVLASRPSPETTGDKSLLSKRDGAHAAPPPKQDASEVQLMVKPLAGPTVTLMLPDTATVAALCSSLGDSFKIDPSAFHLFSFVGGSAPCRLPADGQTLRAVGLAWDSVVTMKLAGPLLGGMPAHSAATDAVSDFLERLPNAEAYGKYADKLKKEYFTINILRNAELDDLTGELIKMPRPIAKTLIQDIANHAGTTVTPATASALPPPRPAEVAEPLPDVGELSTNVDRFTEAKGARADALRHADEEFVQWQARQAGLLTEERLQSSQLREAQKRFLICLLHNWGENDEQAPLRGEYMWGEGPRFLAIWEAFMGAGKSLVLVLIPMIRLEMLSPDFVELHGMREPSTMPHRKVLIEAAGKSLASLNELKNYLQRHGDPPKAQRATASAPRRKKQASGAPAVLHAAGQTIDRWVADGETSKMRLPCRALGLTEDDMTDFLERVHFFEKNDANLLWKDRDVILALDKYKAYLSTHNGDTSELPLDKHEDMKNTFPADVPKMREKIGRAWRLQRAWVVVGNPDRLYQDMEAAGPKGLNLFSLLEIDEMDVAAFNRKIDAPHAQITGELKSSCLQIGVSGTMHRRDNLQLKPPIARARALAPELMISKDLKTIKYQPCFARLVDGDDQYIDQVTESLTQKALLDSARTAMSRTPKLILEACLKANTLDFLREEGLPWSIIVYAGRPEGEGTTANHMQRICDLINDMDLKCPVNNEELTAKWVGSSLEKEVIDKTLNDFGAGRFRILVNHEIVSRGSDYPHMGVTIVMRHYDQKAISSYKQGPFGRALRWLTPENAEKLSNWRRDDVAKLTEKTTQVALLTEMDVWLNMPVLNAVIAEQGLNRALGLKWDAVDAAPDGSTEVKHEALSKALQQRLTEGRPLVFTSEEWDGLVGETNPHSPAVPHPLTDESGNPAPLCIDSFVTVEVDGAIQYCKPIGSGLFSQQQTEHKVKEGALQIAKRSKTISRCLRLLRDARASGMYYNLRGKLKLHGAWLMLKPSECGYVAAQQWYKTESDWWKKSSETAAALRSESFSRGVFRGAFQRLRRCAAKLQARARGYITRRKALENLENLDDMPEVPSDTQAMATQAMETGEIDWSRALTSEPTLVQFVACCKRSQLKGLQHLLIESPSTPNPLAYLREVLRVADNQTGRAYLLLLTQPSLKDARALRDKWNRAHEVRPVASIPRRGVQISLHTDQMVAELCAKDSSVDRDVLLAEIVSQQKSQRGAPDAEERVLPSSQHRTDLKKRLERARNQQEKHRRNTAKKWFDGWNGVREATVDEKEAAAFLIASIDATREALQRARRAAQDVDPVTVERQPAGTPPAALRQQETPPRRAGGAGFGVGDYVWYQSMPELSLHYAEVKAVTAGTYTVSLLSSSYDGKRLQLQKSDQAGVEASSLRPAPNDLSELDLGTEAQPADEIASPHGAIITKELVYAMCLSRGIKMNSENPYFKSSIKKLLKWQAVHAGAPMQEPDLPEPDLRQGKRLSKRNKRPSKRKGYEMVDEEGYKWTDVGKHIGKAGRVFFRPEGEAVDAKRAKDEGIEGTDGTFTWVCHETGCVDAAGKPVSHWHIEFEGHTNVDGDHLELDLDDVEAFAAVEAHERLHKDGRRDDSTDSDSDSTSARRRRRSRSSSSGSSSDSGSVSGSRKSSRKAASGKSKRKGKVRELHLNDISGQKAYLPVGPAKGRSLVEPSGDQHRDQLLDDILQNKLSVGQGVPMSFGLEKALRDAIEALNEEQGCVSGVEHTAMDVARKILDLNPQLMQQHQKKWEKKRGDAGKQFKKGGRWADMKDYALNNVRRDMNKIFDASDERMTVTKRKAMRDRIEQVVYTGTLRQSQAGQPAGQPGSAGASRKGSPSGQGSGRRRVALVGSVFRGRGKSGDFSWEVRQELAARPPKGQRTLWIYNDNEESRRNAERGDGNAAIRPFNAFGTHAQAPLSAGVSTGTLRDGGYPQLTAHVRTVIDQDLARIAGLLATGDYAKVVFSSDGEQPEGLGTGIFCDQVGDDVKAYALKGLAAASASASAEAPASGGNAEVAGTSADPGSSSAEASPERSESATGKRKAREPAGSVPEDAAGSSQRPRPCS